MPIHRGPSVPHPTPRNRAVDTGRLDHFEGGVVYDPVVGAPEAESGGRHREGVSSVVIQDRGAPPDGAMAGVSTYTPTGPRG